MKFGKIVLLVLPAMAFMACGGSGGGSEQLLTDDVHDASEAMMLSAQGPAAIDDESVGGPVGALAEANCLNGSPIKCSVPQGNCYAQDAGQNADGSFHDGFCHCFDKKGKSAGYKSCPSPAAQ